MENVSEILSEKHKDNFQEWCEFLESLGYVNQVYTLDSRNFGIPQSRIRTYMVSVKASDNVQMKEIEDYFTLNNLENYRTNQMHTLSQYLKLDYKMKFIDKKLLKVLPLLHLLEKKYFN